MNSFEPWILPASPCDETPTERARAGEDRFAPIVMIHETAEAYDIELDLMGAGARDVSVKPHPHSLEIRCGRAIDRAEPKRAGAPPIFGSFTTRLHMREAIDVQHADIRLRHGLLHIHAPKSRH